MNYSFSKRDDEAFLKMVNAYLERALKDCTDARDAETDALDEILKAAMMRGLPPEVKALSIASAKQAGRSFGGLRRAYRAESAALCSLVDGLSVIAAEGAERARRWGLRPTQ